MKLIIALTVSVMLVLVGLGALSSVAHSKACMEDDPCFNWRTMGNHSRGIYTTIQGHRVWCILTARRGDQYHDLYLHNCTIAPK